MAEIELHIPVAPSGPAALHRGGSVAMAACPQLCGVGVAMGMPPARSTAEGGAASSASTGDSSEPDTDPEEKEKAAAGAATAVGGKRSRIVRRSR